MPHAKCTWIFTGPGRSWTESLWVPSESIPGIQNVDNLEEVLDYMNAAGGYTDKRVALLGDIYGCVAIRAGFPLEGVRALGRYVFKPGNPANGADDAEISLVTRCGNQTNSRLKYISIRGLWANVQVGGNSLFIGPTGPAMTSAFNSYAGTLTTGAWEWRGRFGTSVANITDIQDVPSGQKEITLDGALGAVVANQTVSVRVSGVNIKSVLNKQLLITRTAVATVYRTFYPYATFPYVLGGKVRYNTLTFHDIANVRPMRIGSRDVGNSFKLSRGRRSNIPRG